MAQFSSNALVSLEKNIKISKELTKKINAEQIDFFYEVDKCAEWIKENNYQKVCLQFPDFMLPDSSSVAAKLQTKINQTVYIMGDTSYESCCIDYVAAAHVDADAIIHFGPKCFSLPAGQLPCLRINEKGLLNVAHVKNKLEECVSLDDSLNIVLDTPYSHYLDSLKKDLTRLHHSNIVVVDSIGDVMTNNLKTVYIGANNRKLMNFQHKYPANKLLYYDPTADNSQILDYTEDERIKKRRHFIIEKIKDSNTVGIVVGTLAVRNYLRVIDRMKHLIKLNNKKYYVISVGKPTVAKLANFPEVDVYVIISCAMNEIFESRDFYQPLATAYDVEVALNSTCKNGLTFSYDFNTAIELNRPLNEDEIKQGAVSSDVSLLTGKIRNFERDDQVEIGDVNNEKSVAIRSDGAVAINTKHGAGFLNERSWKGLEQNLGQDAPALATEGRKGIAQGYENENVIK